MMRSSVELTAAIKAEYRDLLEPEFPRFSAAEMGKRRSQMQDLCGSQDLDAVIVFQAQRAGTACFWLTGWPITTEAAIAIVPGASQRMFIQHYNHLPQARRLAVETDVDWGGASGLVRALESISRTLPRVRRVGLVGSLTAAQHGVLAKAVVEVVDLNAAYGRMRLVKSVEEQRWLRLGSAFTDLAITALAEGARPGKDERELGAIVENAYVPLGGTHVIHFIATTPMADPQRAVPPQFHSSRRLQRGDVLVTEISAQFWDYSGQVLRTFTVGAQPNALYRELHDVAEAALSAIISRLKPGTHVEELIAASSMIEEAGFTTIDDLVHGYGGGYLPPVLGSKSRPAAGVIPDLRLAPGMCVVVQPNVVTKDQRAGVQTGHLMLVTESGAEKLQAFPEGLHVLPA